MPPNTPTMGWQEQFKSLRDADAHTFATGDSMLGINLSRPSTCPVPGTKRVSANAWETPWHAEACQVTSWQDRSLPQTPFSTLQRGTEVSWGRRTKPPSSRYYNYSSLDYLEPGTDEISLQQNERSMSAGGAAGARSALRKKKKKPPLERHVTAPVGFQSRTSSRGRSGRSPQVTPYVSPYKGWKPSTPAPNSSRSTSVPGEMLGYFSGLKLNTWDSVLPPSSAKKCDDSAALCCEDDSSNELKAPEGPPSEQETISAITCQPSQNHNDVSPVSAEEAWGVTATASNDLVSSKRTHSYRPRSPPRKPYVKSSRALIPTRQASLRQADHQALVVVGGNESRASMPQHKKTAAVRRGKGKGSRGMKSPPGGSRHANQAEEPDCSYKSATENTGSEPSCSVQVFQFMDLQYRPVIRRPRPNLFPEPGASASSIRPNSTALHSKRMVSPSVSHMPPQRPSSPGRAMQQRALDKANRFPSEIDMQLFGDGVASAAAT